MLNMKDENDKKRELELSQTIGVLLFFNGIIMSFNSLMWIITGDDTDKWFSRAAMGLICFGFCGVIFRKRK